jgi:hypothetical protein
MAIIHHFEKVLSGNLQKSTSDNLDSVVDFTNIMKTSSTNNITREVRITVALKFENCNFNVTAGKKMSSCPIFFL